MTQKRILLSLGAICLLAFTWYAVRLTPLSAQQLRPPQSDGEVGRYSLVATSAEKSTRVTGGIMAVHEYFVIDTKTGRIWEASRGKDENFMWKEQMSPVTPNN